MSDKKRSTEIAASLSDADSKLHGNPIFDAMNDMAIDYHIDAMQAEHADGTFTDDEPCP